jgi:hypothetical protein
VFVDEFGEDMPDRRTEITMSLIGYRYPDNPTSGEFFGVAGIGPTAEFFGGHERFGRHRNILPRIA